jgi:hypothetical protein
MTCPRCSGLLVTESMPSDGYYETHRRCFSCVNCGFRNDLIFNLNRIQQKGTHAPIQETPLGR